MISFLFIVLLALIIGALTGLLPALPVYTGTIILYYFGHNMPLEHLMVFWLVVITGSQFFGSISTIATKIPGEESSTVYLKDINSLSINQRNALLYDTALGSMIAGIISLLVVYGIISYTSSNVLLFSSLNFQIICYTLAFLSFILLNKNIVVTIGLIMLGLALAPKNNYALPTAWFDFLLLFHGYTFYMVILGIMIVPQLLTNEHDPVNNQVEVINNKSFSIVQAFKSSIIGSIVGLIPGPSAFLASLAAYKTAGNDIPKRIIAAETANNASVITCAMPLLLLALPINQNTLIFSNIMDIRSINIIEAIFKTSFVTGLSVLQLVVLTCLLCMLIYFWLSTHLIDYYVSFVNKLHGKMKYILLAIIAFLIVIDISTAEIALHNYVILLSFFSLIGIVLKLYGINPLPLLFAMILGDKMVWVYMQFLTIHFA